MAVSRALRILSLDCSDNCELHIGWSETGDVSITLTDGGVRFRGQMGSLEPLWAVLNGAAAAARGHRTLVGLARQDAEIDVVAHEKGKGVGLAARFSPAHFSEMLSRLTLIRPVLISGQGAPEPEIWRQPIQGVPVKAGSQSTP